MCAVWQINHYLLLLVGRIVQNVKRGNSRAQVLYANRNVDVIARDSKNFRGLETFLASDSRAGVIGSLRSASKRKINFVLRQTSTLSTADAIRSILSMLLYNIHSIYGFVAVWWPVQYWVVYIVSLRYYLSSSRIRAQTRRRKTARQWSRYDV